MTTDTIKTLSWGQRLAVINAIDVSDKEASNVFGVSVDEIENARDNIEPEENFDVKPYAIHFAKPTTNGSTKTTTSKPKSVDTTNEKTTIKRKPGNPGSKIKQAFQAVTTTPVPLEEFSKQHDVSINVLKQNTRFTRDKNTKESLPEFAGKKFKTVKHNGVLSIWYEQE